VNEPPTQRAYFEPVEHEPEIERRNMIWGLALLGLFIALAVGTLVVALIYNAVSDY
jgi:hypothetical protein